jgi:uncharacterized membrane protein (DUF4010 family)
MELTATFQLLGIALGLGLLVGLQRESVASRLAGVRTFPLITILGTVCALLAGSFGGWIIALGLLALAGLIFTGKMIEFKDREPDPGLTTEIAMLLMFGVGAYLVTGYKEVAIALGGGVAVLLHLKGQLHGLVARLGENDLKAIMQFTLISLVILPVLPDRTYGPYAVLNPRQVWWMVVLIVGISLGGYIVYKFFGAKAGIGLGGILGGVISSTATTVSYSRRASRFPGSSRLAAIVIMIASTVVFARLLLEVAVVQPSFLRVVGPPLLLMLMLLSMLSAWIWYRGRHEQNEMPVQENPSELKSAVFFGLIYALALFAVAAAKERFGNQGLYLVAALSGLTDVDAITLSTSQLVGAGILNPEDGWRLVIMATLSNLIFKAATIALLAHRQLLMMIAPLYGVVLAAGLLLLLLWPVAG